MMASLRYPTWPPLPFRRVHLDDEALFNGCVDLMWASEDLKELFVVCFHRRFDLSFDGFTAGLSMKVKPAHQPLRYDGDTSKGRVLGAPRFGHNVWSCPGNLKGMMGEIRRAEMIEELRAGKKLGYCRNSQSAQDFLREQERRLKLR